jgi:flagellar protein FlgJ
MTNVSLGQGSATGAVPVAAAPGRSKELGALKKACEQFEAVFAKQLLGEMRKGLKDTQFGDQAGAAIYKDMMDQAIGDSIAHQGALGIGKMLYKQFEKQVAGTAGEPAEAATASELPGNTGGTPTLREEK